MSNSMIILEMTDIKCEFMDEQVVNILLNKSFLQFSLLKEQKRSWKRP